MTPLRTVIVLLIVLNLSSSNNISFRTVKVVSSDSSKIEVIECNIANNLLNISVDIKVKLFKFMVNASMKKFSFHKLYISFSFQMDFGLLYKPPSSEKFRKFGSVSNIDWCNIIGRMNSVKNPIARLIFKEAKALAPGFFGVCPLFGKISVLNISNSEAFANIVPIGVYMIKFNFREPRKDISSENLTLNLTLALNIDMRYFK